MFFQLKSENLTGNYYAPVTEFVPVTGYIVATVFASESGLDPIMGFCIDVYDKEKYLWTY